MKNSVKIALGIVAGGVLVFLNQKRKGRTNKDHTFTAPDGNQYGEGQMYRTAEGEVFKNGRKIRFETPENTLPTHNHVETNFKDQQFNNDHNSSQQVSYHQKGDRHR
ncbi:hypothetical protein [Chryseobacterium sp. NKUCC03_KSP]|uniref:hypothetical protein n=1 Tax=Chryseobacterium sp. NKUCC03_KSP TaxID=2842125 RepID=UPI001C5BAF31|nr:hypothetical protein [Chryseobacterium sp. NKUCC03_KSP]MBW3521668.1 hypothetical protein [Chryseobacterium sp. NKUCC03_KSP]